MQTYKASNGVTLARTARSILRKVKPKHILITLRCSKADKQLIRQAAKIEGRSVSQFVLRAATVDANCVVRLGK